LVASTTAVYCLPWKGRPRNDVLKCWLLSSIWCMGRWGFTPGEKIVSLAQTAKLVRQIVLFSQESGPNRSLIEHSEWDMKLCWLSRVCWWSCSTTWHTVLPSLVSLLSTLDSSERNVQRAVCALLRVASYGAQNADNKVRVTTWCFYDMYFIFCTFGIFCVFVCMCFFLKATIRVCHEPGASCSQSMSIFALYCICVSEQINDDDDHDR